MTAEPIVTIEAVEGARLTEGTRRWAESELRRVQEQVGLEPAFDLTVTLGAQAVAERCTDPGDPEAVLGCTVGDGAAVEVVTTARAFSHELVHALRRHYGLQTQQLFEEGFAELVNGSDVYPRYDELDPSGLSDAWQPEAQVQLSLAEFRDGQSYRFATHFLDSVADEHGLDALAEFMRWGIDDTAQRAVERFENHFGSSLAEQAQRWRDEQLAVVSRGDPCSAGAEAVPAGGAVISVELDCDDAQTFGLCGAGEQAWRRRCVSFEAGSGLKTLELLGSAGRIRGDSVPGTCAEGSSLLAMSPFELEVGDAAEVELADCTWALQLSAVVQDTSVSLELAIAAQ